MRRRQRLALLSSSMTSHFRIPQTTNAVNNEDIAYTSASTAENQNESENAYANAPTVPALSSNHFPSSTSFFDAVNNLRPNKTIDQKRNKIVNALATALMILIAYATLVTSPR